MATMNTEKLYESDGHCREFDAVVQSCTATENGRYAVQLDRTAFFPEGGGQAADTGMLGDAKVLDVQEKHGEILHMTDAPLAVGTAVRGVLDWETRFSRMQNHTGEHIVSGLLYRHYGYHNVGFHMGSEDITLDVDGELTRAQLTEIENLANCAVYENLPVRCFYPAPEELATLDYRSKLALTEGVRLVEIPGYDLCACCAPHVARTGEIGIIKLLDFLHYKGGTRIHMLCGARALADYRTKYENLLSASVTLSAPQHEVAQAVTRLSETLLETKRALGEAKREILRLRGAQMPHTTGNLCYFETETDAQYLRELANLGAAHCDGVCAVFSGKDGAYRYLITSKTVDLKPKAKEINAFLCGRGGGSSEMLQGSASTERAVIESYFAQTDFKV